MAMDFPDSPVVGQTFSSGSRIWVWTGTTWDSPASDNPPIVVTDGVRVFADAAARTSAIPTPTEGMLTYLEDTQTYESWDGAAWVAFGGGGGDFTLIARTSFSAVSGQNFDDVFTSDYAVYRVVIEKISGSTSHTLEYQNRVSGVTQTASYYGAIANAQYNQTSFRSTINTNNEASLQITVPGITISSMLSFDVHDVGVSGISRLHGTGMGGEDGVTFQFGGYRAATEITTGFRLTPSAGTITGTVAIYGYGK
jgi:hypothetical protein